VCSSDLLMATTAATHPGAESSLERYFAIRQRGSTVRTEVLGGVVTFLTMCYIVRNVTTPPSTSVRTVEPRCRMAK